MLGRKQRFDPRPIPIARIVPGPYHSRGHGTAEAIAPLATSIRTHGLLYPVIVTGGPKRYELVAGLRRLNAVKRLGWKEIPAIVRDLAPEQAAEVSLMENLHRSEMNEMERIRSVAQLLTRWSAGSGFELVRRLGIDNCDIENACRVISMSALVKESLRAGIITAAEALQIDEMDSDEKKQALIREVHESRQTHPLIRAAQAAAETGAAATAEPAAPTAPIAEAKTAPTILPAARQQEQALPATPDISDGPVGPDRWKHGIQQIFQTFREQTRIDTPLAERIVSSMIQNLRASSNRVIGLSTSLNGQESFLATHTLNATLLALYTGISSGLTDAELRILGLGAIFHDVGMVLIPPAILEKNGALETDEIHTVRKHVTEAHIAIANQHDAEESLLDIILQHHERADGSGYPKGLRGNDVSRFARIMNLIDPYVAMISPRPYRRPYLPHNAMQLIMHDTFEGRFDKRAFQNFVSALSYYPIGSCVQLSGGEIARVIGSNMSDPNRPIVSVLTDTTRAPLPKPVRINLLTELDCKIIQAVPDFDPAATLQASIN